MPLLDIFSNENKNKEKIIVSVDFREKNSLVPSYLLELDYQVNFVSLPVGDYIVNNVAIERKTVQDLKNSIIDKRIFTQMKELKQYPLNLMIIEGKENVIYEIKENNFVLGFILSASLEYDINIIYSNNEKETANYINLLAKKKSKANISINPKKISLNLNEQKRYILESFPNIGPSKAKALIEKFGALNNIFNASEEEVKSILGSKTKDFLELIHHRA